MPQAWQHFVLAHRLLRDFNPQVQATEQANCCGFWTTWRFQEELVGLRTPHEWKTAWKTAFSPAKVTPRLFCQDSFVLLPVNSNHASDWNRTADLVQIQKIASPTKMTAHCLDWQCSSQQRHSYRTAARASFRGQESRWWLLTKVSAESSSSWNSWNKNSVPT